MVFERGKKQREKDEEFMEGYAGAEATKPMSIEEYLTAIGPRYLMIKDDKEEALLSKGQLRNLIPAFNPLNQMSNIDAQEAKIRRLKYKILLLKLKAYMPVEKYAKGGSILISSFDIRSRSIVSDAFHGWKGKILTEQTKTTHLQLERKKKGWLG